MISFVNVVISGLSFGALYALMSIGFSLLWQTTRTINFAQGDCVTLPGFFLLGFGVSLGLPVSVAAAIAIGLTAVLCGYVLRRTVISRLLGRGVITIVIATIALSTLIENALARFWTAEPKSVPALVPDTTLHIGGVVISSVALLNLCCAAVIIVGLQVFLQRTRTGKALQATAQSAPTARILGIDVQRMITIAFIINGLLLGIAGVLVAPVAFVSYNGGLQLGLNAFYAAIIGGFNRVRGALVGGLAVGVLEAVAGGYLSVNYNTAVVLGLLILVILVKPEGLLGQKELVEEFQV